MAKKKKNKSRIERIGKLTTPYIIVNELKSPASFKEWAREGTITQIQSAIKLFEQDEFYEHCQLLMDVIEEIRQSRKKKRWTNK
tara:strand:+ start:1855 stop:2106 length:252 start_codon:yes stop_codon:yes gene_type:complete